MRVIRQTRFWKRFTVITIAGFMLLVLAARMAAPFVVKRLINNRLRQIPGYTGYVNDVRLHLWRGAYSLHGFGILRKSGHIREPFVLATEIDFSIAWRELWRRKFVSDITVTQGQISFVKGPTAEQSQTDLDRRWQDVIQDIFPIDITHLEITDGLLRYVDTTRQPNVNLFVTHMRATATGLRNRPGETQPGEFPAQIRVDGDSLGAGKLNLVLAAEPLAPQPHFHLSLKLDNVDLPALNESLRSYANVDVSRGTFRVVAEMAVRDGGFQGYVKPFFENLDFHNVEDQHKGIGSHIWKSLVAAAAWLVKDKARDQVGTRIPFQGKFGDAKVGLRSAITNLFRHGFIRAFNPIIENSVRADNVLPDGRSADGNDVSKNNRDDNPKPETSPPKIHP